MLVLHGLNHACRYAHHLVAIAGGSVVAEGPPGEVVTEDLVRRVFGLDTRIIPDPVAGTPLVVPLGLHRGALEPTAGSSAAGASARVPVPRRRVPPVPAGGRDEGPGRLLPPGRDPRHRGRGLTFDDQADLDIGPEPGLLQHVHGSAEADEEGRAGGDHLQLEAGMVANRLTAWCPSDHHTSGWTT